MRLTQEKNYTQGSRFNPQIVVSFFNELAIQRKTILKAFVLFFTELATGKRNYAGDLFLIMDSKKITLWKNTM
jgi:hypothetical protein